MNKHSSGTPSLGDDEAVARLVYEYYRRSGKIIPQTPDDVARAEANDAKNPVTLPPRLQNPDLFCDAPCGAPSKPLQFPPAELGPSAENLARAAREGGTISPEAEARMEQDRARAERQADEEKPFK